MAKYLRKVSIKTWLTDAESQERVERGIRQFRDKKDQPSIYLVRSEAEINTVVAAVEWQRCQFMGGKIRKADYVLLTDEQISQAGLALQLQESTIPWKELEGRHYVLTRQGEACNEEDLRRLVEILVETQSESGRVKASELRSVIERHEQ